MFYCGISVIFTKFFSSSSHVISAEIHALWSLQCIIQLPSRSRPYPATFEAFTRATEGSKNTAQIWTVSASQAFDQPL